MTKVLHAAQSLAACLAVALGGLGLFCGTDQSAYADVVTGPVVEEEIAAPCSPVDTSIGSAPCYDKAGAQCFYFQEASTCTKSPNGSNCNCPDPTPVAT